MEKSERRSRILEERLDLFCGSLEWSLLFPEAEVFHLDEHFSDHLPILLRVEKSASARRRATRRFRFENMWVHDKTCKDTIKEAWEGVNVLNAWANLEGKLTACSKALGQWNEEVFGDIQKRIRNLERQLHDVKELNTRRHLLQELGKRRRKEEVLWAQ